MTYYEYVMERGIHLSVHRHWMFWWAISPRDRWADIPLFVYWKKKTALAKAVELKLRGFNVEL